MIFILGLIGTRQSILVGDPTNLNADAPIVISADEKEFNKQTLFYVFGHFSKLSPPDSVRIDLSFEPTLLDIRAVVFLRPDNLTTVVGHRQVHFILISFDFFIR